MKRILLEDLKTGDRIIIPPIGDEPEHSATVDDVADGMLFAEVWGNDRDDDKLAGISARRPTGVF